MKKAVFLIIMCLLISSVYVFADESTDFVTECNKAKVSYMSDKVTLSDLFKAFSESTKISLVPGENNDWRVSEREISIYCKEVPLGSIMKSIAGVTKLVWTKKDENTYVLNYDPNTDMYIGNLTAYTEQNRNQMRQNAVDDMLNCEFNPNQKDDDPFKYLMNAKGVGQSFAGFVESVPGMREALSSGTPMSVKGSALSQEAINNINLTGNIVYKDITDRLMKSQNINSKQKMQIMGQINRHKPTLPQDLSNVTVEVNNDLSSIPGGNMAKNIILGNVVVKNGSNIVMAMPVFNTKNPMVKKVGEAMLEMYENPGADPRQIFESMGGMGAFSNLANDMNEKIYENMKVPIPEDAFFSQEIEFKEQPKTKWNAMCSLAEALNTSFVSDCYGSIFDKNPTVKIPEKGTVKEIVEKINETYGLTCEMNNSHFCFYSYKWFEEIQKLMPAVYSDKWNEQYIKDGYISLENLCEMGRFTSEQLGYGLTKKPALASVSMPITMNYGTVAFLGSLDEESLKRMQAGDGLPISVLTDKGMEKLFKIRGMKDFCNRTEGSLRLTSLKNDDKEIISFMAVSKDISVMPVMVQLNLNKYKPMGVISPDNNTSENNKK